MHPQETFRQDFIKRLRERFSPSEADWLFFLFLEKYCGIGRADYFRGKHFIPDKVKWKNILKRLLDNEPWQYVIGEVNFGNILLKVRPGVLIPRPETEELAYLILNKFKAHKNLHILDLASGSGALAIFLAKNLPQAQVTATDYRQDLVRLIKTNARLNRVKTNVFPGDILNDEFPSGRFNLIVSNPPYVLPAQKQSMHPRVLNYEPHDALFAPENNPVIFYKKIIRYFKKTSPENAHLFFEINPLTINLLEETIKETGLIYRFMKDLQNKWRFLEVKNKKTGP